MTEELREQLDILDSIAPKLNAASQNAMKVLKQVEAYLAARHIGVQAEGRVFKEETYSADLAEHDRRDPRRVVHSTLAYGRMSSGQYSIHVAHDTRGYEMDNYGTEQLWVEYGVERRPWESLSRGDRLKSFATLPSLLKAIAKNAQDAFEEAESAARAVEESMKALGLDGAEGETPAPPPTAAESPTIPAIRRRK